MVVFMKKTFILLSGMMVLIGCFAFIGERTDWLDGAAAELSALFPEETAFAVGKAEAGRAEIGRASCRERV